MFLLARLTECRFTVFCGKLLRHQKDYFLESPKSRSRPDEAEICKNKGKNYNFYFVLDRRRNINTLKINNLGDFLKMRKRLT